ncbi:hypothetical protein TNCV_3939541 [Trichonephila clavipes]|uniref:Uncharacterized protein n=1 Tax=Trichonephila clavipes TaxID=2585209 RepID=A0A8X6VVF1_TRICX|nr:hypothetical protein TNCV_3939541 [Trichonephila clavipes]
MHCLQGCRFQNRDEVLSASQVDLKDKNGFRKCFDDRYKRWQKKYNESRLVDHARFNDETGNENHNDETDNENHNDEIINEKCSYSEEMSNNNPFGDITLVQPLEITFLNHRNTSCATVFTSSDDTRRWLCNEPLFIQDDAND